MKHEAITQRSGEHGAKVEGNYRYYLRAAVLIGVLAGAALGALNLSWIATWGLAGAMPQWRWWPALIQAHGNAQLYGWTGLFIIGIASHSLPRMLQRPAPSRRMAAGVFGLVLGGLVLGLIAQPLAIDPALAPFFPTAMALQWLAVTLFGLYVARTIRRPRQPWAGFVLAGAVWFWLGATMRLGLSLAAVAAGAATGDPAANAAYLHAMTWGFLLSSVLGYSLRLLQVFLGLSQGAAALAWAALLMLTTGTAVEVGAQVTGAPGVSVGAMLLTVAGVTCAVVTLRVWGPVLPAEDGEAAWLGRFVRTAYGWLIVAALLLLGLRTAEAFGPVSPLHQHAFGGASRHALTVGFVSLMIVGVAWRILPIFSGAARPHPGRIAAVFTLLLVGSLLRVWGQIAAGLWGGAWHIVMGLSGWLELLGMFLFAQDLLRLLSGTLEAATLPGAGGPVALSLESPVGPLVAHRPWLVPVFARHGMGQVSNPLFQRTVGQLVTVVQACGRFQVEPAAFLAELEAADRLQCGAQCAVREAWQ
jgi:uncharacterized protein involved in response to NO